MCRARWTGAAVSAILAGLFAASPSGAQDGPPEPRPASFAAPPETDGLLTEDELDELVAPVALYPDSLLTQVFIASTYPIDIVKADRFIAAQAELSDKERATAAEAEDWDPSVQVLTGGFPSVVQRMAAEIDWTEELGNAMLAQTDDLLDAVQRQRARAVALGNLSTNDAQVVAEQDENISIEPADPDVVYVPSYDSSVAFAEPYSAAPVIATADTGYSTANLVTTGAIAFGGALLINELFEDDDDDWDDYWRPGYSNIDWDEGDFQARPNIDIEGDVNIDRDRVDSDRVRIGDNDLNNAGKWNPSAKQQQDARDKLAERKRTGPTAAGAANRDKLRAGSGGNNDARAKLAAASADRKPGVKKPTNSAFHAKSIDAGKAKQSFNRGNASKNKVAGAAQARPKSVTKSKQIKQPTRRPAPKVTAFQKPSGSHGARASKARGGKSAGARKRR